MPRPDATQAPAFVVEIDTLGAGGDGIARVEGRSLYVPFTLPGEQVEVQRVGAERAVPHAWRRTAPDRRAPDCPHYMRCGGCTLQHLPDGTYAHWKRERAVDAVRRAGGDPACVAPLRISPPRSRRRATFAAVRTVRDVALGFHAPASRDVVPIEDCAVLAPAVLAVLPGLRAALAPRLAVGARCDVAVTATRTGLDVVLVGSLDPHGLPAIAETLDLARLSLAASDAATAELVALRRAPEVAFDDVPVNPPPHVFLQATAAGEAAIRAAVIEGVGKSKRVADLFAGCGTLGIPIAGFASVLAVDTARDALAALEAAARKAGRGPRIRIAVRDLGRRPLVPDELAEFDAVVFDPPREGAREQAAALARSAVRRVVAVSCNPASFARDAAILLGGGYALEKVEPIDQFLWSPHLELVATFTRPRSPSRHRPP